MGAIPDSLVLKPLVLDSHIFPKAACSSFHWARGCFLGMIHILFLVVSAANGDIFLQLRISCQTVTSNGRHSREDAALSGDSTAKGCPGRKAQDWPQWVWGGEMWNTLNAHGGWEANEPPETTTAGAVLHLDLFRCDKVGSKNNPNLGFFQHFIKQCFTHKLHTRPWKCPAQPTNAGMWCCCDTRLHKPSALQKQCPGETQAQSSVPTLLSHQPSWEVTYNRSCVLEDPTPNSLISQILLLPFQSPREFMVLISFKQMSSSLLQAVFWWTSRNMWQQQEAALWGNRRPSRNGFYSLLEQPIQDILEGLSMLL